MAALAVGLVALQLLLLVVGIADDLLTPFGLIVPFVLVVAVVSGDDARAVITVSEIDLG